MQIESLSEGVVLNQQRNPRKTATARGFYTTVGVKAEVWARSLPPAWHVTISEQSDLSDVLQGAMCFVGAVLCAC